MEVAVRAEESELGCIEDSGKPGSESATLKQVADPVVYKLVRIDVDGKLVPATDDELLEVENLLELEKNDIVSEPDIFETIRQGTDNDDSKTSQNKGPLQINNQEGAEDTVKSHLEDPLCASDLNSRLVDISHNIKGESGLEDGSNKDGSTDSGPNFSLLKGKINLDRLTIRELQETFRATFGRKTTVKDKMWLKRRIAMGLTNSCDVAVTSFVINDGKFLNKMDDLCNTMVCESSIAGEAFSAGDDMSANSDSHPDPRKDMMDDVYKSSLSDSGCISDNSLEHRAAKRVRKPTKRYIEELSDKETNDPAGKSISPSKCFELDKSCLSSAIKTAWSVNTGAFVTRRDSIGGSGVEVPYVSRVRRCRPRQSVMTLTKFDSSDLALTKRRVESSVPPSIPQSCTSDRATLVDIKSCTSNKAPFVDIICVPRQDSITSKDLSEEQSMNNAACYSSDDNVEITQSNNSHDRDPKSLGSEGYTSKDNPVCNNSDDNVATVLTAKGGMRRKHHRAWTLTEVVKLVDGVSKFGAGRWSEIKRLSFSSYSYRTAVDLKDKWRNLLKASLSNLPAENGMNPRTKAPLPIPAPILVKVRELAEINGQAPQTVKANREKGVPSVNENR